MKTKTILIIDDSELIRDQVKRIINNQFNFFEILEAEDINSAEKILANKIPDILIIDLALPDGNGFELIENRKEKIRNSLKIILTNYPYKQFREKATALDIRFFFDKSVEMNKIIEVIGEIYQQNNIGTRNMGNESLHILVVDDSATLRKMVIASLKSYPNAVFIEAENGLEAIEKLTISKIDAVILDLNMPDIQGMEVLKFIKTHEAYENLKVIILTTRSDEESRNEALKIGADLYLTKPFQPDDLFSKFDKVIRGAINE